MWYSSAWDQATLRAFRAAVTALLKPLATRQFASGQQVLPARVSALLLHWSTAAVPLADSRAAWMATRADAGSSPVSM